MRASRRRLTITRYCIQLTVYMTAFHCTTFTRYCGASSHRKAHFLTERLMILRTQRHLVTDDLPTVYRSLNKARNRNGSCKYGFHSKNIRWYNEEETLKALKMALFQWEHNVLLITKYAGKTYIQTASARHTASKRLQQDIHPNGFSKTYIQTASARYTSILQQDIHPNGFNKTYIQTAFIQTAFKTYIQTALIQTAFSKTYIHTTHSKLESTTKSSLCSILWNAHFLTERVFHGSNGTLTADDLPLGTTCSLEPPTKYVEIVCHNTGWQYRIP